MKIAILSAIVTGAVALNPAEKFHWKRYNATAIANSAVSGGSTGTGVSGGTGVVLPTTAATPALTTIVIATTVAETITKCKPTVTSCPVGSDMSSLPPDALYAEYVTSTVVLATTVCPVSEVQKVSDSIISSISQVNVGIPSGPEITSTQPLLSIDTTAGGVGNGGGGNVGYGGDSTTDATTTVTKTTRATSTVTITRVPTGGSSPDYGPGVGNGSPECTPVTVYVVKPPETVYVTVVPDTGLPPALGLPPAATSVINSSPDTSNPPISEEDDCPVEEQPSSISDTIVEVTAIVIPFPANGTMTKTPSSVGSNSAVPSNAYSRFYRRSPHHF